MFRTFNNRKIENVENYVKDYVNKNPNAEILIGSDSQNLGPFTKFATVIAMYNPGSGAHCIYEKWKTEKERVRQFRLLKEVEASISVANRLKDSGVDIKYIDIDINCDSKFKSSDTFATAKGWVEGSGYTCRWKNLAPLITTAADYLVKH